MERHIEGLKEALQAFQLEGAVKESNPYGSGHINDTFLVKTQLHNGQEKSYILQRMNREIFTEPEKLMENISSVTTFLRGKIEKLGGNPDRETLNVIQTKQQHNYFIDSYGEYWRVYHFIEDATSYDVVEKPEDFYESAVAFGHFQYMLADFPAEKLYETIPNFHNTKARFLTFQQAVKEDKKNRAHLVQKEIAFLMEREQAAGSLVDLLEAKKLPFRVTHNDTKLNNIMMDNKTRKGICVIDLDTVMPGLAVNDFGDSIRFGANTGAEDETDLSKVSLSLPLFELYTKGFIEGCNGGLTKEEINALPLGAKIMTLECGMRFLTDYLQGDTYFKIHRENHNLDRCRTQFKLVEDMEQKWSKMQAIVKQYQN